MLSVLAVIGKIIGFTLLGILGLVLLIVLIVLFVPFRWQLDGGGGKFEEGVRADVKAKVTWLLHLVSVKVGFLKTPEGGENEGVNILAKIAWIRVFPKKEKEKKPAQEPEGEPDAEILEVITAEGPQEEKQPETAEALPGDGPGSAETAQTAPAEADHTPSGQNFAADSAPAHEELSGEPEPEKEKKSFSEKLEDLQDKGEALTQKLEGYRDKAEKAWDFITANTTQRELALLFKRLGKMAKHYLPKKFEGYARLGLSDPATTGKILMYWYSLAYPRVPDTFTLMGEFDEEVIEGDLHLKGRIRLNHIVWFGLRMLLDRKFRKLIKQAKGLMKELKEDDTDREDPGKDPDDAPESGEETRTKEEE